MQKNTTVKKGRPRSFDEVGVLEKSMSAFWQHGFSATNYDVLEQATGLKRQSIVYAFGDKRALFLKSLSHYYATRVSDVVSILKREGSALGSVRCVFDNWLETAKDETKRGCLIVNTSGQFGTSDEEVANIVNRAVDALRKAFTEAFERAQASGEATNKVEPEQLGRLAVAAGNGALLHVHSDENTENIMLVFESLMAIVTAGPQTLHS